MRVGTKIGLGYVVIILMMAGLGAYLILTVRHLSSAVERSQANYRARERSANLITNISRIDDLADRISLHRRFASFLRAPEEALARYNNELMEAFGAVESDIGEFRDLPLTPGQQLEYEALVALWDEDFKKLSSDWARAEESAIEGLKEKLDQLATRAERLRDLTSRAVDESVGQSILARRRVEWLAWGATGVLAAAVTLLFLFFRSMTASRLKPLALAMSRIAAGDYSYDSRLKGSDEFHEMAQGLSRMAGELRKVDQIKRDFISHVSHELKSPLASIEYVTRVLLKEVPGPLSPDQVGLLSSNLSCAERLSRMIGNLLDLSRIESGMVAYEFAAHDMRNLVQAVVEQIQPQVGEKGCEIRFDVPGTEMPVECDEERVRQVMWNLLDNALKFSEPGDRIVVEVSISSTFPASTPGDWTPPEGCQDFVLVLVSDSGPGVDDAEKRRIFEKFHQSRAGSEVRGSGVGLGLAISRRIIEKHRGAVWVEDNPLGGSVFSFVLPRGIAARELDGSAPPM